VLPLRFGPTSLRWLEGQLRFEVKALGPSLQACYRPSQGSRSGDRLVCIRENALLVWENFGYRT
jgi:hypothetical protein